MPSYNGLTPPGYTDAPAVRIAPTQAGIDALRSNPSWRAFSALQSAMSLGLVPSDREISIAQLVTGKDKEVLNELVHQFEDARKRTDDYLVELKERILSTVSN